MPTLPTLAEVSAVPIPDLVARFSRGVENFDRRVLSLSDEQLDTAFLPQAQIGRWPCRILLGHLADAEVAQTHRIRRAVAEDNPLFSAWDENAFIDSGLHTGPIAGYIAVTHTLRTWMSEWLRTLDAAAWARRALHPERGPQTVRTLVDQITWHLEHHAWYLNRKVEKFLGPAPTT